MYSGPWVRGKEEKRQQMTVGVLGDFGFVAIHALKGTLSVFFGSEYILALFQLFNSLTIHMSIYIRD